MQVFQRLLHRINVNNEQVDKYWRDPVWSKVIAGIILAIGAVLLTAITTLARSIVKNQSIKDSFDQTIQFLSKATLVNNFVIIATCVIALAALTKLVYDVTCKIRSKTGDRNGEAQPGEPLKPAIYASSVFLEMRIADAFPGVRGLHWFDDPKVAVDRLLILLRDPTLFEPNPKSEAESDPIWWYRGMNSMYIESSERLSKTKVLINRDELELKRIAVYQDQRRYKCFIYVEAKAEKPTGLYQETKESIEDSVKRWGYSSEPYAVFKNNRIKSEEYHDGSAVINGKVVDVYGAKPRVRYLTDYNFIITSKESPYNSQKFERESDSYFNGILNKSVDANLFFDYLRQYKKHED